MLFEFEGFEVYIEKSSHKGIDCSKNSISHLIICDLMVPMKNRYEVYKKIKNTHDTQNIRSLFLTNDMNIEIKGSSAGVFAIDYILRPFSLGNLVSVVREKIEKTENYKNYFTTRYLRAHLHYGLHFSDFYFFIVDRIKNYSIFDGLNII